MKYEIIVIQRVGDAEVEHRVYTDDKEFATLALDFLGTEQTKPKEESIEKSYPYHQ